MPRVIVEWLEGKSEKNRDQVALGITQVIVNILGVQPANVTVVFKENHPSKLYRGGKSVK